MATAGDWGLAELGSLLSSVGNTCNLEASEKSIAHTLKSIREVHGTMMEIPTARDEPGAEPCTGKGKGFLSQKRSLLTIIKRWEVKIIVFSMLSSARWSDFTLACRGRRLLFISRILMTQFCAVTLLGWKNQIRN